MKNAQKKYSSNNSSVVELQEDKVLLEEMRHSCMKAIRSEVRNINLTKKALKRMQGIARKESRWA
jgi:hypothetical protein